MPEQDLPLQHPAGTVGPAPFLRALAGLAPAQLRGLQPGPYATVAHGAAGVALALLHAEVPRSRAAAWVAWAVATRGDGALHAPGRGRGPVKDESYWFGRAGIDAAQWEVARARRDRAGAARALARFAGRCRRAVAAQSGAPEELKYVAGLPGLLAAAARLARRSGDARVTAAAGALADALLARRAGWQQPRALGLAVGRAGILYAMCVWARETGAALPDLVRDGLDDLARRAVRCGDGLGWASWADAPGPLLRSWCNGTAGWAIVWAEAFAGTKDRAYLELARAAGRATLSTEHVVEAPTSTICCGFAGHGYALLALDGVDPEAGWRAAAAGAAGRALDPALGTPWLGLFKGNCGPLRLAADLAGAERLSI